MSDTEVDELMRHVRDLNRIDENVRELNRKIYFQKNKEKFALKKKIYYQQNKERFALKKKKILSTK